MSTILRRSPLVALVLALALTLAGCGDSESAEDADRTATDATSGTFPASVDSAYGKIPVDKKPERILVIDTALTETLDILGEEPIVVAGEEAELEDYPWLAYDGEFDPKLWTADWNVSPEAVASWKPDLILGNVWGIDEKLYTQLSQIAPTYAGRYTQADGGDTSWQENLADISTLTGHDEQAATEAEAAYDDMLQAAADKLPGLQGKTFQLAVLSAEDQQLWLTEYANGPITGLGLELGEGQPTGKKGSIAANAPKYSLENIDKLTADVVFVVTHEYADPDGEFMAAFEKDPRVPELPASKNGTLVHLYGPQWGAVNPPTPASVAWWLDEVMPQLEQSALNKKGA